MTHPSQNEPAGKGSSLLLWLLLLLLVLILALILSDYGGARQFGQKAYSNAVQISQKVSGMARSLYTCGIQGCPENVSNEAKASAPGRMVVASQEVNAAPATPTTSAPATETQGAIPAAPEPDFQAQMPGMPGSPQYPPYPEQAPDASFDNRETGGSSMPPIEQASAAPPYSTAPMMAAPQQEQPYPPPMMAPMQAMPETGPARPEYPAFPPHPSVMAQPMMQQPMMQQPMMQQPMMQQPMMQQPMMQQPMMAPQRANPMPDRPDMQADYGSDTDGLSRARGSAQAGYFGESVREYRRYLASYPNDIDAYGELGNVYLKMERYPEAAQSYYEAAARLIDAGYFDAVAAMMPIIQTHEPMLASLLNKKMANAPRDNQYLRR